MKRTEKKSEEGLEGSEGNVEGNNSDTAKKHFSDTSSHHYFHVANGIVIKNLYGLDAALDIMSDDTFAHHVNADKNDFATWIRDVFQDDVLASAVAGATDRKHMQLLLLRHLVGVLLS